MKKINRSIAAKSKEVIQGDSIIHSEDSEPDIDIEPKHDFIKN